MSAARDPAPVLPRRAIEAARARLDRGLALDPQTRERLRRIGAGAAPRLARAAADLLARDALRAREVPQEALAGLYEDVAAALRAGPGRARVSTAFLEAPRTLVVWRRVAVAACVLAAISVAWVAGRAPGREGPRPLSQVERYAFLDGVLERYDPAAAGTAGRGAPSDGLDVYAVGNVPTRDPAAVSGPQARRPFPFRIYRFPSGRSFVLRLRGGIRIPPQTPEPREIEDN